MGAIDETTVLGKDLVQVALKMLHHTPPDEDDEFTIMVVESSEQRWKIIERFSGVRKDLQGFQIKGATC